MKSILKRAVVLPYILAAVGSWSMNGQTPPTFNGLIVARPIDVGTASFDPVVMADFTYSGFAHTNTTAFSIRGDIHNTGDDPTPNFEHLVGVFGHATDVIGSKHGLIGVEGKVEGVGNALGYVGVSGDAFYQGADGSFDGKNLYAFLATRLQVTLPESTDASPIPQNYGSVYGLYIPSITGGALDRRFTVYGFNDIVTQGGNIKAVDAGGTNYVQLLHDGSNGQLETTGSLTLGSKTGGYMILRPGTAGFIPPTTGVPLGLAGAGPGGTDLSWALTATTGSFSGSVGIGTNSPTAPLDVHGQMVQVVDSGGNATELDLVQTTGGHTWALTSFGSAGFGGGMSNKFSIFDRTQGVSRVVVDGNGFVGIGTPVPQSMLSVNGVVTAQEVVVTMTGWPDYVFSDNYDLKPLSIVETQIKEQGHLPDIPSAKEIAEKGVSVGEMQALLLKKIEELTLHQIAQEKEIAALRARLASVEKP